MTYILVSGLGGLILSSLLISVLWRRRDEPTARPLLGVAIFVWIAVVMTLSVLEFSVAGDVAAMLTGLGEQSWLVPAFVYPIIALGLWVIFAFQYTGRGDRMAVVTFILVGTLLSLILGPLAVDALVGYEPALALSNFSTFIASFVMAALAFVSLLVIIDESLRMGGYQVTEALVLGGGVLTVAFAPLVGTIMQEPAVFFGLLGVSSLFFFCAIVPLSLFSVLPVARVLGRNQVITELETAVVVIDTERVIQDVNPAAEQLFGVSRSDVVGESVDSLVQQHTTASDFSSEWANEHTETKQKRVEHTRRQRPLRLDDGRTVTLAADPVTDIRGNQVGELLLFQDITERREREQRMGVLNQLLIGTLREQMDTVATAAERIRSSETTHSTREEVAQSIWAETTELMELVDQAREVERTLSDDEAREADVEDVVTAVIENADGVEIVDRMLGEQQNPRTALGITASQLTLLVETALSTVSQTDETRHVTLTVGPQSSYTVRVADSEDRDEPTIHQERTREILTLIADHLGVTLESDEGVLMLTLPTTANAGAETVAQDSTDSVHDTTVDRTSTTESGQSTTQSPTDRTAGRSQ